MIFWLIVAAYAVPLLAACLTDIARRRIPNRLVLAHALPALPLLALAGVEPMTLLGNLLMAAGVTLLCLPLFARGMLGGGDVKLLASTALWVGWSGLPVLLIGTALAGLPAALLVLASRSAAALVPAGGLRDHLLWQGRTVPYGLAIAAGGFVASPWIFT